MSKQSQAKETQGWRKTGPNCGNCQNFTSEKTPVVNRFGSFIKEHNLRCGLGEFKIGKSNWCDEHKFKPSTDVSKN